MNAVLYLKRKMDVILNQSPSIVIKQTKESAGLIISENRAKCIGPDLTKLVTSKTKRIQFLVNVILALILQAILIYTFITLGYKSFSYIHYSDN